jgi:hypothetical protein
MVLFISMILLLLWMALALMTKDYDERIPPRVPCNSLRAHSPRQYPLEMRWYPFDAGIWRRREIPANSILAAASK